MKYPAQFLVILPDLNATPDAEIWTASSSELRRYLIGSDTIGHQSPPLPLRRSLHQHRLSTACGTTQPAGWRLPRPPFTRRFVTPEQLPDFAISFFRRITLEFAMGNGFNSSIGLNTQDPSQSFSTGHTLLPAGSP